VQNGNGSLAANSANASTTLILKSINNFLIKPKQQTFDGYSSATTRSDNVVFGSVLLENNAIDPVHEFKFTVVSKNSASSGYDFGIDLLTINPSGCEREAEYYTVTGMSEVNATGWSGNYYAEHSSTGVGDEVTYSLYYDAYMETNFYNTVRDNIVLETDHIHAQMADLTDGKMTVWQGRNEAGSEKADYNNTTISPPDNEISMKNITVRNLIYQDNISHAGDLVRVAFDSNTTKPLKILSAYIGEKTTDQNCDAATYTQLFFTVDSTTGEIVDDDPSTGLPANTDIIAGGVLPAGTTRYSNWTIFDIDITSDPRKDYYITFHVADDDAQAFASYFAGTASDVINSYLIYDDANAYASQSDWSSFTPVDMSNSAIICPAELPVSTGPVCTASAHVYANSSIDIWDGLGTVTSPIYDTKLSDPTYYQVSWDCNVPSNTAVSLKVRSSDDQNMTGATNWDSVSANTSSPAGISAIGTGRYVQFRAELGSTAFSWTCIDHTGVSVDNATYRGGSNTCPTCGMYLVTAIACPWVDDIVVSWPGADQMCEIGGYFTKKSNYGIIKLTVDGKELIKGLEAEAEVSEVFQGRTYDSSLKAELEPRNINK